MPSSRTFAQSEKAYADNKFIRAGNYQKAKIR
jgi:hypothetical protein